MIFSIFIIFSQENVGNCSKRKKLESIQKSNTLTISQIAETEKYDVHYYNLNLNMTNTSTYLSGTARLDAFARVNLDSALIELYQSFTITDIRVNGTSVNYSRNLSAIKVPVNAISGQQFIIETPNCSN